MRQATLVFALGLAVGLLGVLASPLYDIGAVIVFIGVVGMLTRLGGWLLWLRNQSAASEQR